MDGRRGDVDDPAGDAARQEGLGALREPLGAGEHLEAVPASALTRSEGLATMRSCDESSAASSATTTVSGASMAYIAAG